MEDNVIFSKNAAKKVKETVEWYEKNAKNVNGIAIAARSNGRSDQLLRIRDTFDRRGVYVANIINTTAILSQSPTTAPTTAELGTVDTTYDVLFVNLFEVNKSDSEAAGWDLAAGDHCWGQHRMTAATLPVPSVVYVGYGFKRKSC